MVYDTNNGINKTCSNSSLDNFCSLSINVLGKVMKPILPPLIGKIAKQQESFVIAKMTHFKHPITAGDGNMLPCNQVQPVMCYLEKG